MGRSTQTQTRHEKLDALRQQQIRPYGGRFPKTESIQQLVARDADGQSVTTAGRLTAKRGHGGLTFADLRDASGKIQICLKQEKIGESTYQLFLTLDLGDILGVSGTLFKTKTGEVTVQVEQLTLLAKALRPLPEKWHGLKDVEIRYRQRYLDLIANEPVREVFAKRSRLVSSLRGTLERNGFLEVETPMMHPIPGGAAGAPFATRHHALQIPLYLRLAPELYLKKLLVGGLERVYEINRSFRNEGLSTRHNPEFTMLEAYAAYQDCAFWMEAIQELIGDAAKALRGSLQFTYQGRQVDLSPPWERVSFADAMAGMGLTPQSSPKEIQTILQKKGLQVTGLTRSQLVRLVEQMFEPQARRKPLFVVDYWAELAPLAKTQQGNPLLSDRFELFLGGMEIANAYSEQNDPIEQRKQLEIQLKENMEKGKHHAAEAGLETRLDEDFLEALEYGMPPAGGMGLGVDRLAMLLLDQPSIKDVILFPLLKPQSSVE